MAITVSASKINKGDIGAAIVDFGTKKVLEKMADVINGTSVTGAAAISTVATTTEQSATVHQTLLTLNAVPIAVSDTNVGGGTKIYTFPAGRIQVLGAMSNVAFTTTSTLATTLKTGVTINYGLGSVITATQGSGTLATTQQDILPTTNATASATINVAGAAATGVSTAVAFFDGTSTAIPVHLNVGVAGATDIDGNATLTASGTVALTWINLGDV